VLTTAARLARQPVGGVALRVTGTVPYHSGPGLTSVDVVMTELHMRAVGEGYRARPWSASVFHLLAVGHPLDNERVSFCEVSWQSCNSCRPSSAAISIRSAINF
jgi:hypothetical protein